MISNCIGCGCDDQHACDGGCSWFVVDRNAGVGVCSSCPEHRDRFIAGDRSASIDASVEIDLRKEFGG